MRRNRDVSLITGAQLIEEIRLKIFGSQDLSIFLINFLSDGDSVYSRESSLEISGTPVKTCLICTGTPAKTL